MFSKKKKRKKRKKSKQLWWLKYIHQNFESNTHKSGALEATSEWVGYPTDSKSGYPPSSNVPVNSLTESTSCAVLWVCNWVCCLRFSGSLKMRSSADWFCINLFHSMLQKGGKDGEYQECSHEDDQNYSPKIVRRNNYLISCINWPLGVAESH